MSFAPEQYGKVQSGKLCGQDIEVIQVNRAPNYSVVFELSALKGRAEIESQRSNK